MPAKGRRVASRQAQLGRRRRRQDRSSDGFPVVEPVPAATEDQLSGSVSTQTQSAAEPTPSPVAAARGEPTIQQRRQARARSESPVANSYIGPELRRISILSVILFAVVIVLAFIL